MNNHQLMQAMQELAEGQAEALAAFTVALARVIDRERFAEALRLQMVSFTGDAPTIKSEYRDKLLATAWRSIRHPPPPGA